MKRDRWADVHVRKKRNDSRPKRCRRTFMKTGRDLWVCSVRRRDGQMDGRVNEWFVRVIAACCYIYGSRPPHSPLQMSCSIIVTGQYDTTHTLSCTSKLPLLWWHVITGPRRPGFVLACVRFKVRNFSVHNEWPLERVQMWLGLLVCAVFICVFSRQYVVIHNDCVCCCLLGRWWSDSSGQLLSALKTLSDLIQDARDRFTPGINSCLCDLIHSYFSTIEILLSFLEIFGIDPIRSQVDNWEPFPIFSWSNKKFLSENYSEYNL